MAGKFVTFEGGEGSGKSTQIARLAATLRRLGIDTVTTREPGGAPGAEDIRRLLVSGAVERWTPMAEVLLNYAARDVHVTETIGPALAAGKWVLSDRFADSTMAYQGHGGGVSPDRIRAVHQATLGDFGPDLTVLLDLPVADGLARAGRRHAETADGEDRFERMGTAFHERIRAGFLEIAAAEPDRCVVVDAAGTADDVAARVLAAVETRLGGLAG